MKLIPKFKWGGRVFKGQDGLDDEYSIKVGDFALPPYIDPETDTWYGHEVKSGETLSDIAYVYNVPVEEIKKVNPMIKNDMIYAGQVIMVPGRVTLVYPNEEFPDIQGYVVRDDIDGFRKYRNTMHQIVRGLLKSFNMDDLNKYIQRSYDYLMDPEKAANTYVDMLRESHKAKRERLKKEEERMEKEYQEAARKEREIRKESIFEKLPSTREGKMMYGNIVNIPKEGLQLGYVIKTRMYDGSPISYVFDSSGKYIDSYGPGLYHRMFGGFPPTEHHLEGAHTFVVGTDYLRDPNFNLINIAQ